MTPVIGVLDLLGSQETRLSLLRRGPRAGAYRVPGKPLTTRVQRQGITILTPTHLY